MKELLRRLLKDRTFFIEIISSSFFVNILALATPIFVIQVLQRYVAYGVNATLVTLVAGIVIIIIIEYFFRNLRHNISDEFEIYNATLSNQLYEKIYSIPTAFFVLRDLKVERLKKNIQTISSNLNGNSLLNFIDAPFSVIFLVAVFFLHYQLGLILALFLTIPFILSVIFKEELLKKRNEATIENIKQSIMYHDSVSKNITLKFFSLMSLAYNSWMTTLSKFTNNKGEFETKKNKLSSILTSVATLLTVAIIGWGAVLSVGGELSVGALIGANILASRAMAPIIKFVQTSPALNDVDKSMGELQEIFSLPNEQIRGNTVNNYSGEIKISNLSLTYPKSKNPVFELISFNVKAGEILCITGNNGSGKTSLIRMILGIIPYTRGNIIFDTIEILQLSVNWIRSNISYMPQQPDFIDTSLLNNLIGSKKVDRETMEKAIIESDLADFVNTHPQGLQLNLNDNGNKLPLGIIKRVAFARSLLGDCQVFVLDEPSEGLDTNGKIRFKEKILDLKARGKTIIMATSDKELQALASKVIDLSQDYKSSTTNLDN